MNKGKRNIIFVGFDDKEMEYIDFFDIRDSKTSWGSNDLTHRFPYVIKASTFSEVRRKWGFMLILRLRDKQVNHVSFDIKYRKKFKNFEKVLVVLDKYDSYPSVVSYSKISLVDIKTFKYTPILTPIRLKNMYQEYLDKCNRKYSRIQKENVLKLKNYLEGKTFVKTKDIASYLDVSDIWVKRYMPLVNEMYDMVGYDIEKELWYVVK